jgi:hypothetical protein
MIKSNSTQAFIDDVVFPDLCKYISELSFEQDRLNIDTSVVNYGKIIDEYVELKYPAYSFNKVAE